MIYCWPIRRTVKKHNHHHVYHHRPRGAGYHHVKKAAVIPSPIVKWACVVTGGGLIGGGLGGIPYIFGSPNYSNSPIIWSSPYNTPSYEQKTPYQQQGVIDVPEPSMFIIMIAAIVAVICISRWRMG